MIDSPPLILTMKSNFAGWLISAFVGITAATLAWSIELPAEALANLKAEEFRQRESAQADLLAWARAHPEPAMDALFRHSRVAADPEVRERCLAVLRELVNDEYLKEGEGYIGIGMQDELANIPGVAKPCAVIRVILVVPDSAAQQAGLQPNDLITGLGDEVLREGAISKPFRDKIRQLKPRTKITLKVLRKGKLMDIEVTLGRRPVRADQMLPNDPQTDPEAAERAAKDAYFHRWLERKKSQK
jgi:hypothetical protein